MRYFPTISLVVAMSVAGVLPFLTARNADAVPSFMRQTGRTCTDCHTVFPELTPFGRAFKLGGYTLSQPQKTQNVPIAAMVQGSFTDQKGVQTRINPYDNSPGQFNAPQVASLFYGGKIVDHVGAFSQLTYDGVGNTLFLDNTDVRYANSLDLGGTRLLYGITANNNPTVQDVWNTAPAWRFPSATSAVAVTPTASPVIDGALAQKVGGIGAYGYWNDLVYGEVSVYRTARNGITRPLAAGTSIDIATNGAIPYWRLAVQKQLGPHSVSLGTFGTVVDVFPSGFTTGATDRFTDTALDGQYQYIGTQNVFTFQSVFVHEKQQFDGSFALGNTANHSDFLNTFRANANYYRRSGIGTFGGTIGYFQTTGQSDPVLYAPADIVGSRTGRPDSRGYVIEADYLPADKIKLSLQYIAYNKFNGGHTDYDGSGRNASDNNTLFFVAWLLF